MPALLLFPLLPFAATVLLFAYWLAVAAGLYSAGGIAPQFLAGAQLQPMTLAVRAWPGHCVSRVWWGKVGFWDRSACRGHRAACSLPAPRNERCSVGAWGAPDALHGPWHLACTHGVHVQAPVLRSYNSSERAGVRPRCCTTP